MEVFVNDIQDSLTPVGISQLGTVVYDNIVFPADDNGAYPEIRLDSVSLAVNRPKKIVTSSISGRNGTVKEYVGADDYNITVTALLGPVPFSVSQAAGIAAGLLPGVSAVTGLISATPSIESTATLEAINLLDAFQNRVPIQCKYLQNIFNINHVVVADVTYNKTGADTWTVKLELLSDQEIDLGRFGDGT